MGPPGVRRAPMGDRERDHPGTDPRRPGRDLDEDARVDRLRRGRRGSGPVQRLELTPGRSLDGRTPAGRLNRTPSVAIGTCSTVVKPRAASQSSIRSTRCSGALAPEVTPTVVAPE